VTVQEERAEIEANAFRPSFEAFYRQELQSVIGLAYVLSGSRSGAEDLAQEAFLAALRHWNEVGMYQDPGGWVRRVVANRAVSSFRRRAAEAKALARLGPAVHKVPDLTPEAVATWEAVRQLPRRQAQVIALRYFDGQPAADIARILDCSEATVKTHLQRARRALVEKLGEELRDEDT
jgi:RNA polymerase sigma factor (sigma-70 family)